MESLTDSRVAPFIVSVWVAPPPTEILMVVSPDPLSAVVLLSKPPEMVLCSFAMLVISILLVPALASKLTEAPNELVWLFERERVLKSFASLSFSAPSFKIFRIFN